MQGASLFLARRTVQRGAVGAVGGFLIPRGFAMSTSLAGTLVPALTIFIAVYVAMAALTWVLYVRRGSAFAAEGV